MASEHNYPAWSYLKTQAITVSITIVESFFASVWIGATAFAQTGIVRLFHTVKEIFGWKRVSSGTTMGRFLKKFSWMENNRVFPAMNQWYFNQVQCNNYTLDVDSSVLTRYVSQQGSLRGYNRDLLRKSSLRGRLA